VRSLGFSRTSTRLWKRLTPEERQTAAAAFWRGPSEELAATALAAIVKARHLRPPVARSLPVETKARALAGVLDPGEGVAASLVVALHLDERRALLGSFLDSVGLTHDGGILEEEGPPEPLAEAVARRGVQRLLEQFPASQVWTYFNTLWLQDPDRWQVLERLSED
jgi:hypothetical protein